MITPLNMLKEIKTSLENSTSLERDKKELYLIAHAMMYSQCADSIVEGLDIYDLATNGYKNALVKLVTAIIPCYEKLNTLLDNPRTFEDWQYNRGQLKTRKVNQYRKIHSENHVSMWDVMSEDERNNYKHVSPSEIGL